MKCSRCGATVGEWSDDGDWDCAECGNGSWVDCVAVDGDKTFIFIDCICGATTPENCDCQDAMWLEPVANLATRYPKDSQGLRIAKDWLRFYPNEEKKS